LRDATTIRRQGLAARIDTLQADALMQTDRQGLADAEAQFQVALSALARVELARASRLPSIGLLVGGRHQC
jgi:outer membrane protein TolC